MCFECCWVSRGFSQFSSVITFFEIEFGKELGATIWLGELAQVYLLLKGEVSHLWVLIVLFCSTDRLICSAVNGIRCRTRINTNFDWGAIDVDCDI